MKVSVSNKQKDTKNGHRQKGGKKMREREKLSFLTWHSFTRYIIKQSLFCIAFLLKTQPNLKL